MDGSLQAALFEALDAIRANYPEQGVSMCNELLTHYPDSVRVLRVRAQAYEGMQDWQHASEDYTRVLDTVPTDGNSMVRLARTMNKLGRIGEAQLIARQALDYVPADEDALALAQNVEDGEPNALKPPIPGRVLALRQQFEFGRAGKALASLRKFAAERPHRIDARVVLAELLWRSGARISAAELCQEILDELPDCLPAHTLLALIWKKVGAASVSEAHLRLLERLDPDHRETREWLGDLSPVAMTNIPAKPNAVPAHMAVAGARAGAGEDDRHNAMFTQAEHEDYMNDLLANAGPIAPDQSIDTEERDEGADTDIDSDDLGDDDDNNEDQDQDILRNVAPLTWERESSEGRANPKPWWLNQLESTGPPEPEGTQLSRGEQKPLDTVVQPTRFQLSADDVRYVQEQQGQNEGLGSSANTAVANTETKGELSTAPIDLADISPTEQIEIIAPAGIEALGKQAASSAPELASAPPTPLSRPERRIWQQSDWSTER